jgi:hypothetical protein
MPATSRQHWLERVSVEHALFGAAVVLGAALRLSALASAPLSPDEVAQGLAVWQLSQPGTPAALAGSPAYVTLTTLVAQVGGFTDSLMRLVPALFGLATVLLPYFLRHRTGRVGALTASFLLAISPTVAFAARTAGGDALALFAGGLALVAWLRVRAGGRRAWYLALAAALALGLTSTPLFYTTGLTLLAAWAVGARMVPALLVDPAAEPQPGWRPEGAVLAPALGLFGVLLAVMATGFFVALNGVGAALDLPLRWLSSFALPSDTGAWLGPILALGRYELPLLVLGLPAVVWAAWRGRPWPTFLVIWMVAALLVMLGQPGENHNLLAFALPGYMLVGRFVNDLFGEDTGVEKWPVAGLVIGGGVALYANLIRFSRLATPGGAELVVDPADYHRLLFIVLLAAVVLLVGYYWSWYPAAGRQGLTIGLLALVAVYTWGTGWWLTHRGAADTRERWIVTATDPDLPRMAANLGQISWALTGSGTDLELVSELDHPALRWYLRDFHNARFEPILPGLSSSAALVTAVTGSPSLSADYTGTDFRLTRHATALAPDRQALLQWWFFHDATALPETESAVLWVPSSVIGEAR